MLEFKEKRELPSEKGCEFDHGDVDQSTGRVFVAHTSSGKVEVFDVNENRWIKSIPDCAGGSGVIFDSVNNRVFAASRSDGHILLIDPVSLKVLNKFNTGKKPNGLAVDNGREILMAADVGDNKARFHKQETGEIVAETQLSGRPRWASYRKESDEYLFNIMNPPGVEFISGKDFKRTRFHEIDQKGPHGLAINGSIAYVACDDGTLYSFDLDSLKPLLKAKLAGPPDVLWFNRKKNLVYCSIGEPGVIQAFDGKSLKMVQQLLTERDSHTLSFDEKRQKLYAFLPESCSVGIYQT